MASTIYKYIDLSGEKGKMMFRGRDIAVALLEAAINPLSFCGYTSHVLQTITAATAKTSPDGTLDNGFNDKDVKCILTFLDANDPEAAAIRIAIPAPKIDVLNGIATVKVNGKRSVPGTKAVGALGNDGGELATIFETMFGLTAGDLVFSSGSFVKPSS